VITGEEMLRRAELRAASRLARLGRRVRRAWHRVTAWAHAHAYWLRVSSVLVAFAVGTAVLFRFLAGLPPALQEPAGIGGTWVLVAALALALRWAGGVDEAREGSAVGRCSACSSAHLARGRLYCLMWDGADEVEIDPDGTCPAWTPREVE